MLSLDSPRWGKLDDAYGDGLAVPVILRALQAAGPPRLFKGVPQRENPWTSAWASLCHQGVSIYPASYAAFPHIVSICRQAEPGVLPHLIELAATIEIVRTRDKEAWFPRGLKAAYRRALGDLRGVIADAATRPWDHQSACFIAGAFLVLNGLPELGDVTLSVPLQRPVHPISGEALYPVRETGINPFTDKLL